MRRLPLIVPSALMLAVAFLATFAGATGADMRLPERVNVLPVLFTPAGGTAPTGEMELRLSRHLSWARERYLDMTGGVDTFELADRPALHVRGARSLEEYGREPDAGLAAIVAELFDVMRVDRFSCPNVFVILVASEGPYAHALGSPFNGGVNTGGGAVLLSSYDLESCPHFQATLAHELGHAFGLVHVDRYGHDQKDSHSIMSYDLGLLTRGFEFGERSGALLPEDLRALALNSRVFPALTFDRWRDVPAAYPLTDHVEWLEPMSIPGEIRHEPRIATSTRPSRRTRLINVLRSAIPTPYAAFDPSCMWHSAPLHDEPVVLQISFPAEVSLTEVHVHSQYGGHRHRVRSAQLEAKLGGGWRTVATLAGLTADQCLAFDRTRSKDWRLTLTHTGSGHIVLRGLKFYSERGEVFPVGPPYATAPSPRRAARPPSRGASRAAGAHAR